MPNPAPAQCAHPGCREMSIPRSFYCLNHQTKDSRLNRERTFRPRPHYHLYNNKSWTKNLRPHILARDPQCKLQITDLCKQHGGDASTVADHKKDHKGDPILFYDPANLQGACKPCHDKKTGEDCRKPGGSDPNAPTQTGGPGKQWISCTDAQALARALEDDEDLDSVTLP
jgi:5-methylcytosine-specific restriction protein A